MMTMTIMMIAIMIAIHLWRTKSSRLLQCSNLIPNRPQVFHIVSTSLNQWVPGTLATRESNPETYPNSAQVLQKKVNSGVLGTLPNRPQVLRIAIKSLMQAVPGNPELAPSAANSSQIVDWGVFPPPFPCLPQGVAGGRGFEIYPQSAPSVGYSDQIVDAGGAGQSQIGHKCCI
jgi:hypothetical protein